ncbi:MAG: hypothetical protein DWG76_05030 [Chloroflexi bacterium]|nr:hypothetical protein [Chloroflexota bacterium]
MSTPQFQKPDPKVFLRAVLAGSTLLLALALWQFRMQIIAEELFFTSLNFRAALYVGYITLALSLFLVIFAFSAKWENLLRSFEALHKSLSKLGNAGLLLYLLAIGAYMALVLGFYGRFLLNPFPRLALFWFVAALGASLLAAQRGSPWIEALPAVLLSLALVHNIALFFQQVTTFPLSLDWSEISRYYQASFYASQRVYGVELALPVTHPSRYLLQSIPFFLGDLPLWAHRLWQALLWVGMALVTALVLGRRAKVGRGWLAALFVSWAYLYLMQGAVFYHLLPCVFLVLWGFDAKRFWRSLLVVAVASLWAGISRINWAPLPGALAALLYLLETPLDNVKHPLNLSYWWQPAAYFLGGSLSALGAYWLYIRYSRIEDIGQFGSSFTSALLWDRLWPNAAFPTGILPGILIVSLPLWLVLRRRLQGVKLHVIRRLAVAVILLVFFAGGLVVSVKIGGGTNLHNMDAYMVLLLAATVQTAFGRLAPDGGEPKTEPLRLPGLLVALFLAVPILFAALSGGPQELPDTEVADAAIAQIQEEVDWALENGMEVLFISQRHLITFRQIDAPLVHEYEKLFLMEMAISENTAYLERFHKDIDNWRFGVIITDPLHSNLRDDEQNSLAAENNAWVRAVARPILCAYQVTQTFDELTLQVLQPRFGSKCSD